MKLKIMKKTIVLYFFSLCIYAQNSKPNIIFIMTDDQSSITLRSGDRQSQSHPFGFNGDKRVHTPIIDNLAKNGIIFDNAFVSSSICSPSRYSILTGKYAGRCEGINFIKNYPLGKQSRVENNIELEKNVTNLPRLLQGIGYKTAFVGKSHIIDHNTVNTYTNGVEGFMSYSPDALPNDPSVSSAMAFNHDKWSDRMKAYGFDYVNAFYPANLLELKNTALNVHNVEYKNKAVLDFIESSGTDPFFIYYSETIPHGPAPYNKTNGLYIRGLDSDVSITSKGVVNQDYSYLPSRAAIKNEINSLGKEVDLAWIRWFDHAVGAVISKLKEKGKLDNTLIVITSDHGDYNFGKSTNYEGGIKVPLMMYWPNGIQTPRTYNGLFQNIDFAPTFLDVAGLNPATLNLDGKSFKNVLMTNTSEVVHTELFFEIGFSRAIRTKDWKYVTVRYDDATNTKIQNGGTFAGPNGTTVALPYYIQNVSLGSLSAGQYPLYNVKDQLFDLVNDPFETTNLFDVNPIKAKEMKALLTQKLALFPNRPYGEFTQSMNTANFEKEIFIYPNPIKNRIYIQTDQIISSYKIYNVMGQLVLYNIFSGSIDISTLEKGTYFLNLDNLRSKAFIKL
jgi:arylsulfatase A-like enzyme